MVLESIFAMMVMVQMGNNDGGGYRQWWFWVDDGDGYEMVLISS